MSQPPARRELLPFGAYDGVQVIFRSYCRRGHNRSRGRCQRPLRPDHRQFRVWAGIGYCQEYGVPPLFSVLLLFLSGVVEGRTVSNPLLGCVQAHSEWPADLACVAVLSW